VPPELLMGSSATATLRAIVFKKIVKRLKINVVEIAKGK
jgi:hypothetical protein